MRGLAALVVVLGFAGCALPSFDYDATVMFSSADGPVQLNHQPIAPGAVWSANYSSFADAVRDPSIVEIAGRTVTIGPEACAALCSDCDFDRASLQFQIAADRVTVSGTCSDGERDFVLR